MGDSNQNKSIITIKEKTGLIIGGIVLILLAGGLINFYFDNFLNTYLTQESAAQFGDYLGGILNPILGFATVGLLVWNIHVQLRELKLTRIEMKENTVANMEQADALNNQLSSYKMKEIFDHQMSLINSIEKSIEDLFNKPLFLENTEHGSFFRDTTFGYVVFDPNSEASGLFRRANGQTDIDGLAVKLILNLIDLRINMFIACLADGTAEDVFPFEIVWGKLTWLLTIVDGLIFICAIKKDFYNRIAEHINLAIDKSSLVNDEQKEILKQMILKYQSED